MYMDAVVVAGIATVVLVVLFFVGVGIFVMRDQKAHGNKQQKKDMEAGKKAA
ncbi:MAG: hypothetical protein COB25_013925 [Oceanospirillales bacterium]|jgi:UPF0716 family protein affecting phage T7 exclusion|uniref:cytochrome c oxidase subunit CcoM n=1 Tax=Marinobacter maritimus TaxID=277961 RepID=UPI0016435868|nr:cytochrome c oxidase subunit CcoM [Marinobacter maritimus]MBL1273546.1 hypothetical protein [Oceanospirillales bacterium]|tara:strand:- start:1248 stop:1403 length:156 start_codon:yes stop_codon:yes gene_type:complete